MTASTIAPVTIYQGHLSIDQLMRLGRAHLDAYADGGQVGHSKLIRLVRKYRADADAQARNVAFTDWLDDRRDAAIDALVVSVGKSSRRGWRPDGRDAPPDRFDRRHRPWADPTATQAIRNVMRGGDRLDDIG